MRDSSVLSILRLDAVTSLRIRHFKDERKSEALAPLGRRHEERNQLYEIKYLCDLSMSHLSGIDTYQDISCFRRMFVYSTLIAAAPNLHLASHLHAYNAIAFAQRYLSLKSETHFAGGSRHIPRLGMNEYTLMFGVYEGASLNWNVIIRVF